MKHKLLYVRRKILHQFYPYIPRQIWIGVTYQCQCKCVHCFAGPFLNKNKDELSREEIFKLLKNVRQMGFIDVCYFGGEPLLREDLPELIRFSSSKGLLTSLYTNGILLTKEKVEELRKAGLHLCNVSLDSVFPERHNSLRGYKGCYEKAVEGIENLISSGIKCNIWTYAKRDDVKDADLKDLKALVELGRQLKVQKVVILFPIASGNWLCGFENILTESERMMVRKIHEPPFVVLEFPSEDSHCRAGERMVYVTPHGDVSPCPAISQYYGNVRDEPFEEILKKINSDFSKAKKTNCGECIINTDSHLGE